MTDNKDTSKQSKKDDGAKNTSGGGHVGGTYFGQEPDAKTTSTRDDKGNKVRKNDGRN